MSMPSLPSFHQFLAFLIFLVDGPDGKNSSIPFIRILKNDSDMCNWHKYMYIYVCKYVHICQLLCVFITSILRCEKFHQLSQSVGDKKTFDMRVSV